MSADSVWTAELVAQLEALWDEGVTTAEIGRRIGISKNAVIGKVHRLDLVPRRVPADGDRSGGSKRRVDAIPDGNRCRYPFGDPGEDDFHFCGVPAKPGSPYCADHHARCYTPAVAAPFVSRRIA